MGGIASGWKLAADRDPRRRPQWRSGSAAGGECPARSTPRPRRRASAACGGTRTRRDWRPSRSPHPTTPLPNGTRPPRRCRPSTILVPFADELGVLDNGCRAADIDGLRERSDDGRMTITSGLSLGLTLTELSTVEQRDLDNIPFIPGS